MASAGESLPVAEKGGDGVQPLALGSLGAGPATPNSASYLMIR